MSDEFVSPSHSWSSPRPCPFSRSPLRHCVGQSIVPLSSDVTCPAVFGSLDDVDDVGYSCLLSYPRVAPVVVECDAQHDSFCFPLCYCKCLCGRRLGPWSHWRISSLGAHSFRIFLSILMLALWLLMMLSTLLKAPILTWCLLISCRSPLRVTVMQK